MIMADKSAKNAELRNKNMKHEIMKMKKRLETAFDIDTITTLENKIQVAEADIAELTDQNTQIQKVSNNQQEAMMDLNKEEEVQIRLGEILN